jgi:CDGSH-type Zn-finger protein
MKDGPYIVRGGLRLNIETIGTNDEGGSWTWEVGSALDASEPYALCRFGQSLTKPFCDGTHARVGFDGTETASREPFEKLAEVTDGQTMTLYDDRRLCAYARFCDNAGSIWRLIKRTDEEEVRHIVVHEETHCPSGRLVVRDRETGKTIEPEFGQSISLVEDPAMKCSGPIWVRGRVRVEGSDGQEYEVRNRVTLCRCGASQNKPFCDRAHADIRFNDGLTAS